MSRKLNRKGGMELSVNSIIVIVISVIVLGFILSFISGAFKKVSSQFESKLGEEPNPAAPGLGNPITLSKDSLITYANSNEVLKVSVFNTDPNNAAPFTPTILCTGTGITVGSNLVVTFNQKNIQPRSFETFNGLLDVKAVSPATYLCSVSAGSYVSKDFTITVK